MIVRSKQKLLYDALENRSGIISPEIIFFGKDLISGNYLVEIEDRLQVKRNDPLPGEAIYSYERLRTRKKIYPPSLINQLFDQFGQTIVKGENDYDEKNTATYPMALFYIANTTETYGSGKVTPEQFAAGEGAFELVEEEIVPETV